MKKIAALILQIFSFYFAHSQGLENVIVERYYVSDANDAAGSAGTLPVGSVTYRVYIDMAPGYNFQALYGVPGHDMTMTTTSSFFNNEDYGNTSPNSISSTNIRKNTAMLDSWFSVGAACNGKLGVQKTEDPDGSVGNANSILVNTDPSAGTPISTADGMMPGTATAVTFVGLSNTGNGDLAVLDGISQAGNLFTTNNGSVAALGGVTGPTATNAVLVAQITTDGVFSFELNVQLGTPSGGVEQYVAANPVGTEIQFSGLVYSSASTGIFPLQSVPEEIVIYPNPFNGVFQLKYDQTDAVTDNRSIDIYTSYGSLVKTIVLSSDPQSVISVDLKGFSQGIYFLLYRKDEKTFLHKLINF